MNGSGISYEDVITANVRNQKNKEIENLKQENERLNNKNEELLTLYTTEREVKDYYKNIINELEKWLEERLEKLDINGYDDDVFNGIELALYKLQELKGSDKGCMNS